MWGVSGELSVGKFVAALAAALCYCGELEQGHLD
jgi:hypothetical protein